MKTRFRNIETTLHSHPSSTASNPNLHAMVLPWMKNKSASSSPDNHSTIKTFSQELETWRRKKKKMRKELHSSHAWIDKLTSKVQFTCKGPLTSTQKLQVLSLDYRLNVKPKFCYLWSAPSCTRQEKTWFSHSSSHQLLASTYKQSTRELWFFLVTSLKSLE